MELLWLVYIVDLISKLGGFLTFFIGTVTGISLITIFVSAVAFLECDVDIKPYWKKYFPLKTIVAALLLTWIIPSTQTMKFMAAGYLIQTTFESEFVQETVTLSQKAVIKQLQTWAEDNTDIQELIESVDIPLPKELTKKENTNEE